MHNAVMFIEGIKLGVLEQNVRTMLTTEFGKRARSREFSNIVRLLKGLRLLDPKAKVVGLAFGIQTDGTLGLFVMLEIEIKVVASLPLAADEREEIVKGGA